MNKPDSEHVKQSLTRQYDKFAAKAHGVFVAGREKSRDALHVAIDKTREQMTALGEVSAEQGKQFQHYMQRDLDQTARDIRKFGVEAKDRLNPARIGAGALDSMAALLHAGGDLMLQISVKAEEVLTYRAGEITSAGTLTCGKCGHATDYSKTSFIFICTACKNNTFKKSY